MKKKGILSIFLVLVLLFSCFQLVFAEGLDNITEYNMEVRLDAEKLTVEGKEEIRFINTYEDSLKELVFHLYPDSYESYETLPAIGGVYLGEGLPEIPEEEKGYINILKVYVNGEETEFVESNQILKVHMKNPIVPGEEINISIEFLLKIPKGYHRLHYMEGVYSLTNWYPILSVYDEEKDTWDEKPFHPIGESNYSNVSNYNVKLIVPKNMVVAPTGTIVEEVVDGQNKIVSIKAEKVRDFVIIMSPNYKVLTREVDGIKISNYYLSDEKSANILIDEVAKAIKFLNKTFGKYPYDELKIAETYLSGGAMEYPQVIQMGRYGQLSMSNKEISVPWTVEAAVHETVHQWWYVGVGNNEYEEPFLDESLTVFTTAYYFEKEYDPYHENGVKSTICRYLYSDSIKPLNSSVDDFENWSDYSYLIYTKAPAFFEDLRQRVGEDTFINIMRTYYERYLFKNATIEDLLDIIGEIAGKDIEEAMAKALKEPNYYPEHIRLTEEENRIFLARWAKERLKNLEKANGLIIGSIALRAMEGEEVVIVKPNYIAENHQQSVNNLLESLVYSFMAHYNVEIKVVDEKDVNEEMKKNNLIIVGYPEKNSLLMEIGPDLPIDLTSDTIELNKLTIKNDRLSGIFISENPYNKETLSLIIFFDDEIEDLDQTKTTEIGEEIYIYKAPAYIKYNPVYADDIQFIIDADNMEIRGMYK